MKELLNNLKKDFKFYKKNIEIPIVWIFLYSISFLLVFRLAKYGVLGVLFSFIIILLSTLILSSCLVYYLVYFKVNKKTKKRIRLNVVK